MLALTFLLAVAAQIQSVRPYREPTKARIAGTVLDENGAPLAGAQVEWRKTNEERGSRSIARAVSRTDGRFELVADPEVVLDSWSECVLSLEFPGLAPTRIDGLLSEVVDCELGLIHIYPFAELHGRVVDHEGNPVAGASVHALQGTTNGPNEDTWGRPPVATTDVDGRFACRNVPSGLVTLGVSAEGFADLEFEPRSLALRAPNELEAVLQPSRSVVLHVHDEATGAPLLATCTPLGPTALDVENDSTLGNARRAFWRAAVVGDLSGRVVIDALPTPFDGGVLVEAKGHSPRIASLAAGDVVVQLRETLRLDIRATRKGSSEPPELMALGIRNGNASMNNLCGFAEELNWASVSGNSSAVDRLALDHWSVEWHSRHASVSGGAPSRVSGLLADGSRQSGDVVVAASGREAEVVLEFGPPSRLVGRVVSPKGEGMALGLLIARQLEPTTFRFETDNEGRFDVQVGAGSCWLFPEDQGWTFPTRGHRLELAPGETRDVELRPVATKLPNLRVHGRVTVAGERPGRPLLLALEDEQSSRLTATTWTDEDGRFEFVAPCKGTYRIVPKLPDVRGSSWRDLRREFVDRSRGATKPVVVDGEPLAELEVNLPPLAEWPGAPRSER